MSKFTRDSFNLIVRQHELRMFDALNYLLLDCNLMFSFSDKYGYAEAHGVIPMELATEMYNACKGAKEKIFANDKNNSLKNPMEIALHPSIVYDKIRFTAYQTGRDFDEILQETRNQVLKNDYDNCYIDFSCIYSPEAFVWYIETVKAYYDRKRENARTV